MEECISSVFCQPVAQRRDTNVPFGGCRCGLTLDDVLRRFVLLSASGAIVCDLDTSFLVAFFLLHIGLSRVLLATVVCRLGISEMLFLVHASGCF